MPAHNQFEAYSVILLEHGGRFLLLKRSPAKAFAPNRWTGIGGHVEAEEFGDLKASALRELREEAGFEPADLKNFSLRRTLFLARPDGIFIWLLYFTGNLIVQATPDCPEGMLAWKEPHEFVSLPGGIIPTSRPVLSLLVEDLARDPQGLEGVHAGIGVYDSSENYHHILWDSRENNISQEGSAMSILSNSVHTGLFVENVEKMVLFYRDILGFESDWDGGPYASFKVNDGGLFMFDRKQFAEAMNQPYGPPQGFNLTMEIGLDVPTKADVDREYVRLMALGVHSAQEPQTQPWGQRNFWITDPEGNYIEVGSFHD